jgi:hypothetical protein
MLANGTVVNTWGVASPGADGAGFYNPEGIVAVGSNTVYVADRGRQEVDQYTVSGTYVRSFEPPVLSSRLPVSVTADRAGNVYSVDRDGGKIDVFTPTGGFIRSIGTGRLRQPTDAAVDAAGNVYVAETTDRRVSKFAPNGGFIAIYDRAGARTFAPVGIEVAPSGDLYIADGAFAGNGAILRVRDGPVAPLLGKVVNAAVVKGTVLVSLPAGASAAKAGTAQKGQPFVPLSGARQIPVGSVLDTSRGTARLTSATGSGSKTQSGNFAGGVFQVLQSRKRSQKGLTELRLKGSSFAPCKAKGAQAIAAAKSKRKIRRLRGNAKGRFRSRGRYSSATVRGTDWTVTDRCDGTLTTVKRGKVAVRDFRRHKTIIVRRGKRYLARAR